MFRLYKDAELSLPYRHASWDGRLVPVRRAHGESRGFFQTGLGKAHETIVLVRRIRDAANIAVQGLLNEHDRDSTGATPPSGSDHSLKR